MPATCGRIVQARAAEQCPADRAEQPSLSRRRRWIGEEFGEHRLVEVVVQHRHLTPDALLHAITASVHAFSGTEQEDDVTLVGVRGR